MTTTELYAIADRHGGMSAPGPFYEIGFGFEDEATAQRFIADIHAADGTVVTEQTTTTTVAVRL